TALAQRTNEWLLPVLKRDAGSFAEPVDHRPLGQVGQRAPDARQRAVQHQTGADQLAASKPAQRLAAPAALHRAPRRALQERQPRAAIASAVHKLQVLVAPERSNDQTAGRFT